jgi:hypothetical protein
MTRTQVQFTDEQVRELHELAEAEGRSVADLVREGVDALLRGRPRRSRAEIRRRAKSVRSFRSGLRDVSVNHDRYLAEDFLR